MCLNKVPYLKECVATFVVTLSMVSRGTHAGWTSSILPKLLSPDSHIHISNDEASWIAALIQLGGILGSVLIPVLVNRLGRRTAIALSTIPFLASWIILLLADSYIYLYVGRLVSGFGLGTTTPVISLYLVEIASKEIRGSLGLWLSVSIKIGVLLSYCIGPYVSYDTFIYILMVIPITLLITIFWIPESPIYYLIQNREKDALKSLRLLRPQKSDIELQSELEDMNKSVKTSQNNRGTIKDLFGSSGNRKSLIIMAVIFSGMYLSGYTVFIFHAVQLFQEAAGFLGANESAIILAFLQLVVGIFTSLIVDKIGRRPLLLASESGIIFSNMILGGYFFIKDYQKLDVTSVNWIPLTAMIIFIISYSFGLSTVPYLLLGELLPVNVKGIASGLLWFVTSAGGFGITKLFQVITDAFGIYVSYWIFGTSSSMVAITIYCLLPETRGKSLGEIQASLNKENNDINVMNKINT